MGCEQRAVCPENDALVEYMRKWWKDLAEKCPKNYTPNTASNIQRAFTNLCKHKTPITTLHDFKTIKGIGKWLMTQMRDFFNTNSEASQENVLAKGGKKARGSKAYLPQKNSAAYALLISLYRGTLNGIEFMRKQDLIDAAEASGLSRVPIAKEMGKGKPKTFGNSPGEWYTGWNAMKTLVEKGLVCKTSCPAKYMLSEKGRQVAIECLTRSGMCDVAQKEVDVLDSDEPPFGNLESVPSSTTYSNLSSMDIEDDIPQELLERETMKRNCGDASTSYRHIEDQQHLTMINEVGSTSFRSTESAVIHVAPLVSSSLGNCVKEVGPVCVDDQEVLRLPPLEDLQKFDDAYKVILILDDREHFTRKNKTKLIEKISDEFKIEIEVRRLPVGDGIWIARHKQHFAEYVLDFIVERKNVDDLRSSIRDNRYRDQKLRLQRTGMKKIMYLVEGDPNACDGADNIKTACFTTEILEGFNVQRTSGCGDTLRRYGYLTFAITDYYKLISRPGECKTVGNCLTYAQFIKKCEDVDKMTVSDLFATQLMQVSQVTEDVAIAVVDCFPTLFSLAHAYADLDEDIIAQEELLTKKCKGAVSLVASKNIFRFVWA